VPSDSVHDLPSARPWVLKVEGGRAHRQDLRLGLHTGGSSEVLDGLKSGELIVSSAASPIGDGARLRPLVAP